MPVLDRSGWDLGFIPPYPSSDRVPCPEVPPPPKLDAGAPAAEQVRQLLRAYWSAFERRTGKRCFLLRNCRDLTRSRPFKALLECARALLEHEVAPVGWVEYSFNTWTYMAEDGVASASRSAVPPLGWAFAAARVRKHGDEDHYLFRGSDRRMILTDAHRELLERYTTWKTSARRLPKDTLYQGCVEHVERHWGPGGREYDALVRRALADGERIAADLRERADRGEWLWD